MNAAKLCGGTTYRTLYGVTNTCDPHPSSFLYVSSRKLPECVVFSELVHTSRDFMRHVVAVKESYVVRCWNRSGSDVDVELLSGMKKRKKKKKKKRKIEMVDQVKNVPTSSKKKKQCKESAIEAARRRYLERRENREK